jgi:hypothetical protein
MFSREKMRRTRTAPASDVLEIVDPYEASTGEISITTGRGSNA